MYQLAIGTPLSWLSSPTFLTPKTLILKEGLHGGTATAHFSLMGGCVHGYSDTATHQDLSAIALKCGRSSYKRLPNKTPGALFCGSPHRCRWSVDTLL